MTGALSQSSNISPLPLAADLRSADNRDCPSRTDVLGAALANVVGGPVGRHALIGRTRLMTPLRVMFAIALVFLALGWSTKAACLQSTGTGQVISGWPTGITSVLTTSCATPIRCRSMALSY